MEYQVVSYSGYGSSPHAKAIEYVASRVNSLIGGGWKPQGGISITCNSETDSFCICQAMIKED